MASVIDQWGTLTSSRSPPNAGDFIPGMRWCPRSVTTRLRPDRKPTGAPPPDDPEDAGGAVRDWPRPRYGSLLERYWGRLPNRKSVGVAITCTAC